MQVSGMAQVVGVAYSKTERPLWGAPAHPNRPRCCPMSTAAAAATQPLSKPNITIRPLGSGSTDLLKADDQDWLRAAKVDAGLYYAQLDALRACWQEVANLDLEALVTDGLKNYPAGSGILGLTVPFASAAQQFSHAKTVNGNTATLTFGVAAKTAVDPNAPYPVVALASIVIATPTLSLSFHAEIAADAVLLAKLTKTVTLPVLLFKLGKVTCKSLWNACKKMAADDSLEGSEAATSATGEALTEQTTGEAFTDSLVDEGAVTAEDATAMVAEDTLMVGISECALPLAILLGAVLIIFAFRNKRYADHEIQIVNYVDQDYGLTNLSSPSTLTKDCEVVRQPASAVLPQPGILDEDGEVSTGMLASIAIYEFTSKDAGSNKKKAHPYQSVNLFITDGTGEKYQLSFYQNTNKKELCFQFGRLPIGNDNPTNHEKAAEQGSFSDAIAKVLIDFSSTHTTDKDRVTWRTIIRLRSA